MSNADLEITEEQIRNRQSLYGATGNPVHNEASKIAFALFVVGWVEIVSGIICGFYFGNNEYSARYDKYVSTDFKLTDALIWWVASTVSGLFTMGFGKLIELLQRLVNKFDA